jgi:prevent-host-death family protein
MKPTEQVKPVSYLKAHTAELIRLVQEAREPVIVTQNGEAKAVLRDIASYEEDRETPALLKILALGSASRLGRRAVGRLGAGRAVSIVQRPAHGGAAPTELGHDRRQRFLDRPKASAPCSSAHDALTWLTHGLQAMNGAIGRTRVASVCFPSLHDVFTASFGRARPTPEKTQAQMRAP